MQFRTGARTEPRGAGVDGDDRCSRKEGQTLSRTACAAAHCQVQWYNCYVLPTVYSLQATLLHRRAPQH